MQWRNNRTELGGNNGDCGNVEKKGIPVSILYNKCIELLSFMSYSPKKASSEVRKKLLESKESVVLNAMFVVEAIVKNTPSSIHREFLSQELLTSMKALVENQDSGMSRAIDKILEVLGEWKAAFGEDSAYKGVSNVFTELERGGYYIPEATIASASYIKKVNIIPYWVELIDENRYSHSCLQDC